MTWNIPLSTTTPTTTIPSQRRVAVTPSVWIEKQVEVPRHYSVLRQKDVKLLPNLRNMVRCVANYQNLTFYIEHGLQLTKIHRAIQFQQ